MKEDLQVGHFMNHPESQNEFDRRVNPELTGLASMKANGVGYTGFFRALLQRAQHLRLDISGNDASAAAHKPGKPNGKKSHSTPHIHNRHPFFYIRTKYFCGVVKNEPQRVVDCICQPPRANMLHIPISEKLLTIVTDNNIIIAG